MNLDLPHLAGEIARNVGQEFPPTTAPQAMVLRQYPHLVEEGRELTKEIRNGTIAGVRDEAADVIICCYLIAHYTPSVDGSPLDLASATVRAFPSFAPAHGANDITRTVHERIADVAGPLRRYLGIARRSGHLEDLALALGMVVLVVQAIATRYGFDLDKAIEDKAQLIFSRGWRETPTVVEAAEFGDAPIRDWPEVPRVQH